MNLVFYQYVEITTNHSLLETLEQLIEQIPIRHNVASHLMFLGVTQAFFISLVIFIKAKRGSAIQLFGWSLLFQAIVCTDTYLCYTGLIKYTLVLNDSTEPFVLLILPCIYFFIHTLLERKTFSLKEHWPHLMLPILYAITQIGYYTSPLSVKLNAYLDAYHDHIGFAKVPDDFTYSYQIIKDEFRWLILISFLFYLLLSAKLFLKTNKSKKLSPKNIKIDKYTFTRNTVLLFIILFITFFIVYWNFEDDSGDHFIVIFVTITTFFTSFFILSESRFFENSWLADRYDTLTSNSIEIGEIESVLFSEDYYLSNDISLKSLSEALKIGPNTLSKVINSESGMNFNDYINQKRIEQAKVRLLDNKFSHLTIEAVGNSVGFNSKSAFYSAFKKHTGTSPSAFLKSNKTD